MIELDQILSNSQYPIQIRRLSTVKEDSHIAALRSYWQNRADEELLWERAYHFLDLGVLLLTLIILYRSVLRYVHNVRSFVFRDDPTRAFWKPLLLQAGIFLVGCVGILLSSHFYLLVVFLAPVVLVVWLFEAVSYAYLLGYAVSKARSSV